MSINALAKLFNCDERSFCRPRGSGSFARGTLRPLVMRGTQRCHGCGPNLNYTGLCVVVGGVFRRAKYVPNHSTFARLLHHGNLVMRVGHHERCGAASSKRRCRGCSGLVGRVVPVQPGRV